MKIFTFLLNLFDKYKYQGELLLFLLKYLVKKPDEPKRNIPPNIPNNNRRDCPTSDVKIKIPKAIIKNIGKLIKDQDKIQKVISSMKSTIIDNPDRITTNTSTPNSTNFRNKLQNTSKPSGTTPGYYE